MKFKKTTLPSGLRIITVPMKDALTATVLVMVEAGSNYESQAENGLSHFIEHMCFKGTASRPTSMAVHQELDGLGSQTNAFTGDEFTGYYAKAERKQWKHLLDIISDIYLHSTFPAAELEKERGVILQEIAMHEDEPRRHVWDVFLKLLYGDVPAGRPVIGPKENIKTFTRDMFEDYRSRHYVAAKTIIAVAGDVKESEVRKEIALRFKNIPKGKKLGKDKVVPKQSAPRLAIEMKDTDQMHLVMGFHSYPAKDKRNAALSVLCTILGGGFSSRLFHKLRDEMGVCYYIFSGNDRATDHGVATISAGIDPKRVKEVVSTILAECKRLADEPVTKAELDRTKDYIVGNMYLGLEGTDDLAERYVFQEIQRGELRTPQETEKRLRAVTAKDIQKVAKEIFKNSNLNLAVIGKIEDEAELKKVLTL